MSSILLPNETNKFNNSNFINFNNIPGIDKSKTVFFCLDEINSCFTNHSSLDIDHRKNKYILETSNIIDFKDNIFSKLKIYINNCINCDSQGNIYFLLYDDNDILNQYLVSLDKSGILRWAKKLTDLSNTTSAYHLSHITITKDDKIIISGTKNYRTGTQGDASIGVFCLNSNGNIIWNVGFTDNPSSGWVSSGYANNIININSSTSYLIIDSKPWVSSQCQTAFLIINPSTGALIKHVYVNNLNSSIVTYNILPFQDFSSYFWAIYTKGYIFKVNISNNTGSGFQISQYTGASSFDKALIDNDYNLYVTDATNKLLCKIDKNTFNIIWAKKFSISINDIIIIDNYLYTYGGSFILKYDLNGNLISGFRIKSNSLPSRFKLINNKLIGFLNPVTNIFNISLENIFNKNFSILEKIFTSEDVEQYDGVNTTLTTTKFTSTLTSKAIQSHTAFTISNLNINNVDYNITYGHQI